MNSIQAYFAGIITSCLVFLLLSKIKDYLEHMRFCLWLKNNNVDVNNTTQDDMDKHYIMYKVSRYPNVEVVKFTKNEETPL